MNSPNPLTTVCDLKWNYPIFNMDRGEFRSCCRTPAMKITEEALQQKGINAFLNSDEMIKSRLDLIQGKRHSDCQSCWNIEDANMASPRHGPKQFWDHLQKRNHVPRDVEFSEQRLIGRLIPITKITDSTLLSYRPYMVEINLGSTCDMKCMYCSHHYSTQWATERIKYGEITQSQYDVEFPKAPSNFDEKFWEWFDAVGRTNITRLGIIGGEPLIMPEFYKFVERIIASVDAVKEIRQNKITFWLVTNMNTPSNYLEKFLTYLPKLSEVFNVEILVSMESVGKRAEYIRNGVNWDRFVGNVNKVLARKDLSFEFGCILSLNALNLSSLQDFIKFTEELYHTHGRPVALKQNIISFPDWQTPAILTPDFAEYLYECVTYLRSKMDVMPKVADKMACWDQYADFLENLGNSIRDNNTDRTSIRHKFVEWFATYDERRKLSLIEVFPEYATFYHECRGNA